MFKPIGCVALALLSAFAASSAFAEAPRIDTMKLSQSEAGAARGCTPNKRCVEIASGDLSLTVSGGQLDPAHTPYRLADLFNADEDSSAQIWPQLVRFEGGFLAGVQTQMRAMYSGGGADATTLHLIAYLPGQAPFEVLSVPQSAYKMIRACFSERDMKQRAGACHDEYNFDASLALTGESVMGMPVLRYRSKATSFPGPVSPSKDSLAGRPLRKRDIATVTDPQCSYQRVYRFDAQARSYVANTPPPDCSDYTDP